MPDRSAEIARRFRAVADEIERHGLAEALVNMPPSEAALARLDSIERRVVALLRQAAGEIG